METPTIVQTSAIAKTATFTRGGALKSEFAFTQGNVISNAGALRVGSAAPLRGGEFASPDFFVRLLV